MRPLQPARPADAHPIRHSGRRHKRVYARLRRAMAAIQNPDANSVFVSGFRVRPFGPPRNDDGENFMNVNVPNGDALTNSAQPMEWPQGELTRIPFWIYQAPEIYAQEQKRIYRGPVWNYLCLEAEVSEP